jgi:hypothetical protein
MPKVPQGQINGYEIGFSPRGARKISVTMRPNAQDALKTVRALEASEEEIRYIKAPGGYEIGIGELQLEAERKGNANVKNPSPT